MHIEDSSHHNYKKLLNKYGVGLYGYFNFLKVIIFSYFIISIFAVFILMMNAHGHTLNPPKLSNSHFTLGTFGFVETTCHLARIKKNMQKNFQIYCSVGNIDSLIYASIYVDNVH